MAKKTTPSKAKTPEELAAEADAEAMGGNDVERVGTKVEAVADAAAPDGSAVSTETPGEPAPPPKPKRQGTQVADGPTTGYRDGPKGSGLICCADFLDGFLPKGWQDTPAKCSHYDETLGNHQRYVKVSEVNGKWGPPQGVWPKPAEE